MYLAVNYNFHIGLSYPMAFITNSYNVVVPINHVFDLSFYNEINY